jgi:hypothetical protein
MCSHPDPCLQLETNSEPTEPNQVS